MSAHRWSSMARSGAAHSCSVEGCDVRRLKAAGAALGVRYVYTLLGGPMVKERPPCPSRAWRIEGARLYWRPTATRAWELAATKEEGTWQAAPGYKQTLQQLRPHLAAAARQAVAHG